ncbi:MAG TPA: hypothetical protein VHC69_12175 [Polyangiaceae bacterium]|nr:hypothetical protein [Polyangiaceae bacterium]
MRLPGSFTTWSIAVSLFAFACTPSIGDSCKLHTDCSATGDRLCEPTLPNGYCTIANCEPDSCPSEAACVAFGVAPSVQPECRFEQQQRLERTYCMARCSSDSGCRSGYSCVDLLTSDNIWGAAVVDANNDRGTKICTVRPSSAAETATNGFLASSSDQVCSPPDASFPPPPDAAGAFMPGAVSGEADASASKDGAAVSSSDARAPASDAARSAPDAQGGP